MALTLHDSLTHPYLLLLPFLLSLLAFRRLRKPSLNPPPGPPPLPFFGNLHNLGEFPHISSHLLAKKHGPLIRLDLGQVPTLFVCDADTAAQVLKSQDSIFCSRAQLTSLKRLTYGGKDLAFCPFGDHWKQVRRLCNAEVFNLRKIESFGSFRRDEVELMVGAIAKTSSRGEAVNFSEMMVCYFNNLLFREVFCERASADGECGLSPFQSLLREVNCALSGIGAQDLFPLMPLMSWVDVLSGWRGRLEKAFVKMDLMFEEKIRKRMSLNSEGKNGDGNRDLLDALLNLRDKEDHDSSLSMNTIKGVLMNMFTAGIDTSAVTIEWGMTELMKNPEALNKAQEEVHRVIGNKKMVEESDLQHLHYLKQIIKETLRLHPPGPLLPPRESMKDTKINGYDIPAKTTVYVNVWSVGRDPKYWDDPEVFRPERFMNINVNFKGSNFELIPFGSGRRICPGITLAMANIELAFANVLYGFNWGLPNGMSCDDIDMTPVPGLITPKKLPLILVATPSLNK